MKIVVCLLLPVALAPAASSGLPEIDSCLVRPEGPQRISCIEERWSGRALGGAEIEALERLLETDPAAVESIVSRATEKAGSSRAAALHARLKELHGDALFRLGRYPESAEAFLASLHADDGTPRLSWFRAEGKPAAWSVSVGPGRGKLARAARALLRAERRDEARDLLARALALGAEGWAREAWGDLGGGAVRGLDPEAADLLAPLWFRYLPDLEIPMLDGEPLRLSSARGKVLLLDFWASWCTPCLRELPHMQSLYEAERDKGLLAVAVNADEPARTAKASAEALGLTVPVGMYSSKIDEAFTVRALPTVILADRHGRIRERWNGYADGLERSIAASVKKLLVEEAEETTRPVARVILGRGRLEVRWSRELEVPLSGLAAIPVEDGTSRVAACGRGRLVALDPRGAFLGSIQVPAAAGKLVGGDLTGDGRPELVAYRPGARSVVFLDTRSGSHKVWNAPFALLDAAILPAGAGHQPKGKLVLGAEDGLYFSGGPGEEAVRVEGVGRSRGVAIAGSGPSASAVVLDSEGSIRWVDPAGTTRVRIEAPENGWKLVSEPGGVGVFPAEVVSGATGRFLAEGRQAALATASGQLVLLDLADGAVRFRAFWPGIGELSAGDLDGDGREELLVASGRRLSVLGATRTD